MLDLEAISTVTRILFDGQAELALDVRDVPPLDRFCVIPGKQGIRWIVPVESRCALPVLRQWTPYDPWSRMKWAALMAAYRLGGLDRVPGIHQIGIAGANTASWAHAGLTADGAVLPVIYVGTPGPGRKAVSTLVNLTTTERICVVKVPISPAARNGILREADVIVDLQRYRPGAGPELAYKDTERGLSVQQAVSGLPSGTTFNHVHAHFLARLQDPHSETSLEDQASRLLEEMSSGRSFLAERDTEVLNAALLGLRDDTRVPAGWTHGDFAPWNILCGAAGDLICVDWEDARTDRPFLHDLFHFHYIQDYLFGRGRDALSLFSTDPLLVKCLHRHGVTEEACRRWSCVYLVDSLLQRTRLNDRKHAAFLMNRIRAYLEAA